MFLFYDKYYYDEKCKLIQKSCYFSDDWAWLNFQYFYENDLLVKNLDLENCLYFLYDYDSNGDIISIKNYDENDVLLL